MLSYGCSWPAESGNSTSAQDIQLDLDSIAGRDLHTS